MKKYLNEVYKFVILVVAVLILVFVGREVVSNINVSTQKDTTSITFTAEENDTELQQATLVRVVDGDTIIANLNGKETRMRLIGVNTPESVHPDEDKNTYDGKVASEYTKSQLKEGQIIYIETDEELYDKYDRMLVYLWLTNSVDTNNLQDISQYMFNAILIKEGYAEIMTVEPNVKYENYFRLIDVGGK